MLVEPCNGGAKESMVGVRERDNTAGGSAKAMGVVALVMGVGDTVAPPTDFPQGAVCLIVVWDLVIALETVGECTYLPLMFLAHNWAVRWSLGCMDGWDSGGRGCSRACAKEMGLEVGANC